MQLSLRTRFYFALLITSSIFLLIIIIADQSDFNVGRFIYLELAFNLILAIMSYEVTCLGAGSGNGEIFYGFYMATVLIRILLTLTIFILYFILMDADKQEKLVFILSYFFFYFAYTILEVKHLMSKLQDKRGSE
ncbi:hypothetical protein AVL50_20880 [Flammeovirga sp. SJP92]|nr:hypothetical protein AVL50_20880 [Flammeovirga sp. SJP92]